MKNVKYVATHVNSSNVPQARPIESFWGYLAQKVYERGWEDTTEEELILRIKYKIDDFHDDFHELPGNPYGRCQGDSQIYGGEWYLFFV